MQGLASLLNPIREFVSRQPRPEVDQLMQDIQGRITEFMGSPVGPPNNIFQEPMPSRPILGIPDQPPSFGPVKTFLEPSFNYGREQAEMRMMQRDVKSAEEQAYIDKILGTNTPSIPTDLMAGFRSSEFALPPNAMTDQAMGNVGLADGRNFNFGSLAETGAFKQYLDSIGQEYNKNTGMNMFNIPQAIAGLPSIFR